ncbi:MAG: pantoate kinase [Archaeoglobaceae archaeon]
MTFFAPASITCFFSVHSADRPYLSGSTGVGITLDLGARATICDEGGVRVNGDTWDFPTVDYVIEKLGCDCGVDIEMDVPAGCGFGMSGASALATAFEINQAFDLRKSFFELADVAHEAEIMCKTGMGDVVCQCYGGVVVRKKPGSPSRAVIDRFLWKMDLDLLTLGPFSTQGLLKDEEGVAHINELGGRYVGVFLENPQVENLFKLSRIFATETELLDSRMEYIVQKVEARGGLASMIMLGRAIFAINGFEVLQEFGEPFRASLGQSGVKCLG